MRSARQHPQPRRSATGENHSPANTPERIADSVHRSLNEHSTALLEGYSRFAPDQRVQLRNNLRDRLRWDFNGAETHRVCQRLSSRI